MVPVFDVTSLTVLGKKMIELTNNGTYVINLTRLADYISLLRLSHWSKSLFVMLGFFYTSASGYFARSLSASFAFCLISSAVYIYNDIQDRSEDSVHPHKCHRPLACDRVSVSGAILMLFLLLISGIALAWFISKKLAVILCIYLVINLAYNHLFKLIPILDVASIATGFMLRVLAGTVGIDLPISIWLAVTATLLSLFIALNKRRLEMNLGLRHSTRKVLSKYHPPTLRGLILLTGGASFLTYLFYTLFARAESFYFIVTLPFFAIALWRFAWLATQEINNDDPVSVFINDRLSRINLWCFAILTFMALTR